MPDLLLSDLCAICHVRPHKYRCPRCSARTCSLPCVKRHKQWSQCNGVRDPSTYIKRSDLATARGIDHDYNYLTSIERQLDGADRDATQRGIALQGAPADSRLWRSRGRDGPNKGDETLKRELEQRRVIIDRAPEGMVRRRQNTTSWHKGKHAIQWTVAWIHPDGRQELGRCLESVQIATAYATQVEFENSSKEDGARPKKRRRHQKTKGSLPKAVSLDETLPANQPVAGEASSTITSAIIDEDSPSIPDHSSSAQITSTPQSSTAVINTWQQEASTSLENMCSKLKSSSEARVPSFPQQAPAPTANGDCEPPDRPLENPPTPPITTILSPTIQFYLHAPRLPSPRPVLIPLSSHATLSECLQDRLVLEFPTIYVIHNSSDYFGDEFITEEAFFKQMQENGYREKIEAKLTGNEEGQVYEDSRPEDIGVDERKLEEVLTRDLKSLQGVAN